MELLELLRGAGKQDSRKDSALRIQEERRCKIVFQTVGKAFLKQEGISSRTSATMEEFMGTPDGMTSNWRGPY